MENTHYKENKIYYHDTDAGGVVYYANYLKHLEEGRSEFMLTRGINTVKYASEGFIFPVVHLEVDYKSPARYGDVIRVYTRSEKVGNASVSFSQEIKIGDRTLLEARIVWACVGPDMKPKRVPEAVRKALTF